jgi:long-subunit fatty acid transport protein
VVRTEEWRNAGRVSGGVTYQEENLKGRKKDGK